MTLIEAQIKLVSFMKYRKMTYYDNMSIEDVMNEVNQFVSSSNFQKKINKLTFNEYLTIQPLIDRLMVEEKTNNDKRVKENLEVILDE